METERKVEVFINVIFSRLSPYYKTNKEISNHILDNFNIYYLNAKQYVGSKVDNETLINSMHNAISKCEQRKYSDKTVQT